MMHCPLYRKWLRNRLVIACSLNKTLSLLLSWHHSGFIVEAFMSLVLMISSLALTLVTFVLVVVVAHFNSQDQFFFTFFKSSQTFPFTFTV